MGKMTQCEKIVKYMEEAGGITQRDAFYFGCQRLASRIHDLKKQGYNIKSEMVEVTCADGTKTYVAKYSLMEEGES